ncbi:UNVERIFIED_CONTAM: hypothetical protein PYX00_011340 [Menopon gallinae]|uniref:Uncharacterized protein n=1 Tax=Menopon gallinae TaxID=328185 RepID=A0AAW2H7E5_9NEOP
MTPRNGDTSFCEKHLDVVIDCGVYKKETARKALKCLLAQSTISSQQFKFIVSAQKSGMCRSLVHRALIKFKPLFDISSTCGIAAEPVHEYSHEPYSYEEVLQACANYAPNDSYRSFTKNYHAVFNENRTIRSAEQQKFANDLLALMGAFEAKRSKRPYFRRFAVRDSLMFFIRQKTFNDFLRFQIFAIFKSGKLDDSVGREMFDSEVKWRYWRAYGFPAACSGEEFSVASAGSGESADKGLQAEPEGRASVLSAFMESKNASQKASGDSAEWYLIRERLFNQSCLVSAQQNRF